MGTMTQGDKHHSSGRRLLRSESQPGKEQIVRSAGGLVPAFLGCFHSQAMCSLDSGRALVIPATWLASVIPGLAVGWETVFLEDRGITSQLTNVCL